VDIVLDAPLRHTANVNADARPRDRIETATPGTTSAAAPSTAARIASLFPLRRLRRARVSWPRSHLLGLYGGAEETEPTNGAKDGLGP
jgi:hypothetical protein